MILILREDKRFYVVKPNFKTTKGIYKPGCCRGKGCHVCMLIVTCTGDCFSQGRW